MAGRKWTNEEIDFVKRNLAGGRHPKDFLEELNKQFGNDRTLISLEGLLKRQGLSYGHILPGDTSKNNNIDIGIDVDPNISWEDAIDLYSDVQKKLGQFLKTSGFSADIEIKTDKPIVLVFVSDIHIGSPATDYEAFKADMKLIHDNPNLYLMKGGDWIDNFQTSFKDASAVQSQLDSPEQQLAAAQIIRNHFIKQKKILAEIGGNHDTMSTKQTGIDQLKISRQSGDPVYLPFGGLINVRVGKVKYGIIWKHKWGFNSRLNKFNSHHRMRELLYPMADIYVQEDKHDPAIEQTEEYEWDARNTVLNLRTGSYKKKDAYSMQYFKAGRIGPQAVVLYPDRKHKIAFHGEEAIRDSIVYLNGIK